LGTAVLGGVVAGPAVLVSGFFLSKQAEKVQTAVEKQIAKISIAKAQMKQEQARLAAIDARIDELQTATVTLDTELKVKLEQAVYDNLEDVYQVARLARGLADLIDTPVVNE
jgi:predicted transcriptional regulator